ncbi:MAG: hypothetical protein Kow0074_07260 [Candidatus Zixiibacteriota bacterium]
MKPMIETDSFAALHPETKWFYLSSGDAVSALETIPQLVWSPSHPRKFGINDLPYPPGTAH